MEKFTERDLKVMLLFCKTSYPTEIEMEYIFELYKKYIDKECPKFTTHSEFCKFSLKRYFNVLRQKFENEYFN